MFHHRTRTRNALAAMLFSASLAATGDASAATGKVYEFASGLDGWTLVAGSGAALSQSGGALVQTLVNPGTTVFTPVIFAGASYDGNVYKHFAMKVTVTGAPPGTFDCTLRSYTNQFHTQSFPLRNGTQVVRVAMNHVGTVSSLELDMPGSGLYASYQGMVIRIHWIAVTDEPQFRGMAPESLDPDNPANADGLALADDDRGLLPGALPDYFLTPAPVEYGFGTTVGSDGSVYFGQYSGEVYRVHPDSHGKITLFSRVSQPYKLAPSLFSLHMSASGQLYAGNVDTDEVRRVSDNALIFGGAGGQDPMQITEDGAGNLYVAWQGFGGGAGRVQKRTPAGAISDVDTGVHLPQGVAVSGGDLYHVNHTRTDPRCDPEITGTPLTDFTGGLAGSGRLSLAPGAVTAAGGTLASYWRARGMTTDARSDSPFHDQIYVVEEANAWDQGNSARITRYDPVTDTVTTVVQGLDYPEFPDHSAHDGRVYFTLARDRRGAAFDPGATFSPANSGSAVVPMSIHGGTWDPQASGQTITLSDPAHPGDELVIEGKLTPTAGAGVVSGWLRVPDAYFPAIDKAETCADGCFAVPDVAVGSSFGKMKAVVLPLRGHREKPRWPAVDCGLQANPEFDESPDEYVVFFQWAHAGVAPGSSLLIGPGKLQLSDTFNAGFNGRTCTGEVPAPGSPALSVEGLHGNSPRAWPHWLWALHKDGNAWAPYPGGSTNGSALGMTQSVSTTADWGIPYNLSSDFIVQADWVQTTDRVDITASNVASSIAGSKGISVFFRASGGALPEVGIYNAGVGEFAAVDHISGEAIRSGVGVGTWHNYAVRFDLTGKYLSLFVDEELRGVVNLTTFRGGAFLSKIDATTNDHVNVGYAQTTYGQPVWSDNFQVGTP